MTTFIDMNSWARNLICFIAILLIFGFITITMISLRQKKYVYAVVSAAGTIFVYFIMQICRNISCYWMGDKLDPIAKKIGNLPFMVYVIVMVALILGFIIHVITIINYSRTHITPMAVKEALDLNPSGICFYRENGQVILANYKMNSLAFLITGGALLNGLEFYEALRKDIIELKDGTVIRFSHREMMLGEEPCHELIADDITEIYRKTEMLREENEALSSQNERMKEYGENIDDTVRRQEVLTTKLNIHDEMNRLLLSTDTAIQSGDEEEKKKILETWQKNILLLCMEAKTDVKNNAIADLESLAKVIGVTIEYDRQPQTDDSNALYLFSLATEEAMTNAAKHGNAKRLFVKVSETGRELKVEFTDDGMGVKGNATEGGGLSALRSRIEDAGGSMQIIPGDKFLLSIVIPKGGKNNVL